jgi:amino acid permease
MNQINEPFLQKGDSWIQKLTKVKPETITKTSTYKKHLTRFHLTMYGVGNTIGAGIFALTGIAV